MKLWIGLGACVALATGFAYFGTRSANAIASANTLCGKDVFVPGGAGVSAPIETASGLRFQTVHAGDGAHPGADDVALVAYKGKLKDGTVFDENARAPLAVNAVVPGFSEGLKLMQRGGSYRMCIPPALAYGAQGVPGHIPPNATISFAVDLADFKSQAELEMQAMQMQQQRGAQPPAH